MTITLADFGKDFERGLAQGHVDRHLFAGFRRKAELPRFLGGFLDRVFDRNSGVLLNDPCTDAIRAIRQLTLTFGKLRTACSDVRQRRALREFIECESDVRAFVPTEQQSADLRRMSALLYGRILAEVGRKVYLREVMPKHGPGAVAEKLSSNGKFEARLWTTRLDSVFPMGDMLIPNHSHWEWLQGVHVSEPGAETPVRVVTVPKTLKAPRVIGIEPVCMQYVQQAIAPLLVEAVERDDILRQFIGFTDQSPNQELACEGSVSQDLATLDLSEASDRVSNLLVRDLFDPRSSLYAAVDACRSTKADVPGEGIITLSKFASMGSALTFPVEAMMFLSLILLGIERELRTPLDRKALKQLRGQVRVYGDDLIVPVRYVRSVVETLEAYGFKVNSRKSFWTGRFRESCGKEYYGGVDVSIVRVRQMFPTHPRHATEVISLVSLRNQFYMAGYWKTCEWLDNLITRLIHFFPVVEPTSSVQGRHSFLGYQAEKLHRHTHGPLVKGWRVVGNSPRDPLDGEGALLKWFLKRGDEPFADRDHLERAGRPKRVDIKLGYASPY